MHPFIPFVTEEIWLKNKLDNSKKNFLMLTNWPSGKIKKDVHCKEVEKMIIFISQIRSFKNELNVGAGSFVDLSIESTKKEDKLFFLNNDIILKKLGRINHVYDKDQNKPSASLVVLGGVFKLYFDQSVDLNLIKENLVKKKNKLSYDLKISSQKLANNSFVEKAPKNIVDKEKTNYTNLKNDIFFK